MNVDDAGLVYVVNTNRPNLTLQANGSSLNLAWPPDRTGWRLQAQTNGPGAGIGTNWSLVPGSTSTNFQLLPLCPSCPSVFYRLKLY